MSDPRPDELHIDRFSDSAPGQRGVYAMLVDLALSIGLFFGVTRLPLPSSVTDAFGAPLFLALAALVGFSLVNRVLLQLLFRASIGKALLGVRAIRTWDAGRPTLFDLLRSWLCSFAYALAVEAGSESAKTWQYTIGVVTRGELRDYREGRRFFRPTPPPSAQYPPVQPPPPGFPPGPPYPPAQGYPPRQGYPPPPGYSPRQG